MERCEGHGEGEDGRLNVGTATLNRKGSGLRASLLLGCLGNERRPFLFLLLWFFFLLRGN